MANTSDLFKSRENMGQLKGFISMVLILLLALVCITDSLPRGTRIKRMINGQPANVSEWRFLASLKYAPEANVPWKICSATLIARTWLVTMAHCVQDVRNQPVKPEHLKVMIRKRDDSWQTEEYRVTRVIVHPRKIPLDLLESIETDIALIKLEKEAPMHMQILQVHQLGLGDLKNCSSAGWGSKSILQNSNDSLTGNYQISAEPQSINIAPLVSWTSCDFLQFVTQKIDMNLNRKFFCGGATRVENDYNNQYACIGDSGSPLVCEGNAGRVLRGLVLGGNPHCIPGSLRIIFVDVTKHQQWLNRITAGQ